MGDTIVPLPDIDTESTDVQSMITNWVQTTVTYHLNILIIGQNLWN